MCAQRLGSNGGAKIPFSQLLTTAPYPWESLGGQFLVDKSGEATQGGLSTSWSAAWSLETVAGQDLGAAAAPAETFAPWSKQCWG